jgi:hypothetical protein
MNKVSWRAFQWDQKCNKGLAHGLGGLRCGHKQNKNTYIKVKSECEFELNGFLIPFNIFELKIKIELFELI